MCGAMTRLVSTNRALVAGWTNRASFYLEASLAMAVLESPPGHHVLQGPT